MIVNKSHSNNYNGNGFISIVLMNYNTIFDFIEPVDSVV